MKRSLEQLFPTSKLLRICLIGVVIIVALMPIHAFLSTWFGTLTGQVLLWKSWKELLLIALFVCALIWLFSHPAQKKQFLQDKVVLIIGVYSLLSLFVAVLYLPINGLDATTAGIAMNLRYPLIFVLTYGIFLFAPLPYEKWRSIAARFVVWTGITLSVIGLLQVTVIPKDFLSHFGYDKFTTIAPYILIDQNPNALRAFATLRGPNDFGAFLILPLLLSLLFAKRDKRWLVASALIMVAIIASGARSAWIGAIVAIIVVGLSRSNIAILSKKTVVGVTVGLATALSVLVVSATTVPALRLAIFHSSPGDTSLTEGSTDDHWKATAEGVGRVISHPLGCGPGCAGPASYYGDAPKISENYYVQIAEETGWIGVALFTLLYIVVARRLWRHRDDWLVACLIGAGAGISVIGLLLHVWSDDPLSLTWWSLAGMTLGALAIKKPSKSVKKHVS